MIFNKIVYLCVFLVTIISCSKREISPNIIFILTDDQGYNDLGCYGAKDIETPNIDKLAEKEQYLNLTMPLMQFVLHQGHRL